MSTKPHRLDWTLSATPTRRGVRVFLVAAIPAALLGGCILTFLIVMVIAVGPRAPERSFTALDFFPPASAYPADYEVVQAPRWAGDYSPLGIGDNDDAYAEYKPESEAFGGYRVVVFYAPYRLGTRNDYRYALLFTDGNEPISEITFQSARAQEWTLGCRDVQWPDALLSCGYVARYDEFVVLLSATVGRDHLSLPEFEHLLRAVDQRAIELLGPMPAPAP